MSFPRPPPGLYEIDVSCANCGTKVKKSLGWLKENDEFVCGNCGMIVDQCGRLAFEFEKTSRIR